MDACEHAEADRAAEDDRAPVETFLHPFNWNLPFAAGDRKPYQADFMERIRQRHGSERYG